MQRDLLEVRGREGHGEGADEGEDVGGRGEQERLGAAVAERLDDRGEEVL